MKDHAIILFTRIPTPGKTKTRLQPFLTGEECCILQRAFIRDIYSVLRQAEADILVCYAPEGNFAELESLAPGANAFFPQSGSDLGSKMHNAICHVLGIGYRRCLLIGSDIPLLKTKDVDEALRFLNDHDISICPSGDGGYYLIGMNEPCEAVFRLEKYSVSTVIDNTIAAISASGKSCAIGACAMDIDTPQDLIILAEKLKLEPPDACIETRMVLKKLEPKLQAENP